MMGLGSLIVCPHTQDTNRFLFGKNLIDNTVLNIDASRVGASKITNQLFEGWGISKRIVGKNRQQFLRPWLETTCGKLFRILHCLLRINNLPIHHLSAFELFARGSAMPALIDSRMPGTASRYKVS